MKKPFLLIVLAGLAGCSRSGPAIVGKIDGSTHASAAVASDKWKVYKGPYFEIQYPPTFRVVPKETDGASFVSPDKTVQFYIFSPQWNGESREYAIDPEGETLEQKNTESVGSRKITRLTYKRNDGWKRSFEDVEDTLNNTRRIFGVYYSTAEAYTRYKSFYVKFKGSLRQFAD